MRVREQNNLREAEAMENTGGKVKKEIEKAERLYSEGKNLDATVLYLELLRCSEATVDEMAEIIELFAPAMETYMRGAGIARCPNCRAWAAETVPFTRCEICGAVWLVCK